MALAAGLGVLQLGAESLWLDESSSVAIASRAPADLWTHLTRVELNGSAYYLLLSGWMALFGQTEVAIRSLSVVFAVATVPVIYATGRLLFDRWVAVAATLVLVTSAFVVSYEQEARAYAMALFLTSLSTFLFIRGLQRSTWPTWLLYVAVAAVSVYAHFFAGFVIVAHALSLLVVDRAAVRWRPVFISYALLALLVLPALRFALFVENAACRTQWVPSIDADRVGVVFWELVGANEWLLAAIGLSALVALLAVWLRRRDRSSRWPVVFALLLVGVPVVLSLAISVYRPLLATRYLIVALPGLAYLAAFGLASLRPRLLGAIGLAVIIGLSSWSLVSYYQEPRKADFRSVAEVVASVTDAGDAAIVYQRYGDPSHLLVYYLDHLGVPGSNPTVVDLPDAADYVSEAADTDCPTTPNDAYRAAVDKVVDDVQQQHDRVVLVIRRASDDPFLPILTDALDSRYDQVERILWAGTRWYPGTELRVYDAPDATAGAAR
ncbi:MAG: glycosyltransferase family 39 protein [Chloroflexota bacterium]